jgi:anti-sigma factor RsiW
MSHLGSRLAAYVDGELSPATLEMVESHLATCAECSAEVAAEKRLKAGLAGLGAADPSDAFLAKLLDISRPPVERVPTVRPLAPAASAERGRAARTPAGAGAMFGGSGLTGRGFDTRAVAGDRPARRLSMAAASVVSVAAATIGAAFFGGEATAPRPAVSADLLAVQNSDSGMPAVSGLPVVDYFGGLVAAGAFGAALTEQNSLFGSPGFGLAVQPAAPDGSVSAPAARVVSAPGTPVRVRRAGSEATTSSTFAGFLSGRRFAQATSEGADQTR